MLGKLLGDKRKSDGILLKDMAVKIGYTNVYLSEIENRKKVPKNGITLKKLADNYGVDFDLVMEAFKQDVQSEVE